VKYYFPKNPGSCSCTADEEAASSLPCSSHLWSLPSKAHGTFPAWLPQESSREQPSISSAGSRGWRPPSDPWHWPSCCGWAGRGGGKEPMAQTFAQAKGVAARLLGQWKSQNHRIVGVGRDLCGSPSPTLLLKQGHPEQAAQHCVQEGLEYLQRRRLHSLPGQPVPVFCHPQREEGLPHLQLELPVPQFVPIAPCPVTGHHWKCAVQTDSSGFK